MAFHLLLVWLKLEDFLRQTLLIFFWFVLLRETLEITLDFLI